MPGGSFNVNCWQDNSPSIDPTILPVYMHCIHVCYLVLQLS